jgi:DNA-binding NarL/FixJ family response regulator
MCRALRVLCVATTRDRLSELKRAAVSVHWELAGGAISMEELLLQLEEERPDVVVIHSGMATEAVEKVRRLDPNVRIVTIGEVPGADEHAPSIHEVKEAILGLPRPGGPVRL